MLQPLRTSLPGAGTKSWCQPDLLLSGILQVRCFKRAGTLGIMDAEEKSKGVKGNVLGEVGKSRDMIPSSLVVEWSEGGAQNHPNSTPR